MRERAFRSSKLLLAAAALPLWAQQESGRQILETMETTRSGARISRDLNLELLESARTHKLPAIWESLSKGPRTRMTVKGSSEGPLSVDALIVSDGVLTWALDAIRKEYRRGTDTPRRAVFYSVPSLGVFYNHKSARLLGSEKITAAGAEHDCWVIEVSNPIPFPRRSTWYIGKADRQLWRMHGEADMQRLTVRVFIEVRSIETGLAMDDSLFVFTPGPDALPSRE